MLFQHSDPVRQQQQMLELLKWRKFPLPVPISASSKPCLPCGACPLTQTPAASASTAVQSLFCLEGTNMWYQFIILDNATRNSLALKIK